MSFLLSLARMLEPHQQDINLVKNVINARFGYSIEHLNLVNKAHFFSSETHNGQSRDDGQPYIVHPNASLIILTEWGGRTDPREAATALMHDCPEDHPSLWPLSRLVTEFDSVTAEYINCCNRRRFDHIQDEKERENEFLYQLLDLAPAEPCRAKCAERLHNGLTSRPEKLADPEWRNRKLAHLRYFYIPMARKHGFLYQEMIALMEAIETGVVPLLMPP